MFNVVFRHRARMATVYGRVSPLPLVGARFGPSTGGERDTKTTPRRPGELGRIGRHFVLIPMPHRVREAG